MTMYARGRQRCVWVLLVAATNFVRWSWDFLYEAPGCSYVGGFHTVFLRRGKHANSAWRIGSPMCLPTLSRVPAVPSALLAVGSVEALVEDTAWQRGIQVAIGKELLPSSVEVQAVTQVKMDSRSADSVAAEIFAALAEAPLKGCVITVQGFPTVEQQEVIRKLQQRLPNAQIWRVNTFFRTMAFLLLAYCEQTGSSFQDVLAKPEMLAAGVEMIEEMVAGRSLGDMASDAERMMQMSSDMSKVDQNAPLAIEYAQGEVIAFLQSALSKVKDAGANVIIDGPEETLQYFRTPHRFEVN